VSQTAPAIQGNIEIALAANRWNSPATGGLSLTRTALGRATRMDKILGRVMTVAGAQTTVILDANYCDQWITARLRRCLEHSRIAIPDGRRTVAR